MRAASTFASAFTSQDLCSKAGLTHLKTVNHLVAGPQGLDFDGAIIASGDTGVSVLWFIRTSSSIELFCAEPLQCSSAARSIVESYLQ
jgi:DNA polymerase/3'-5' exonuclease PolX